MRHSAGESYPLSYPGAAGQCLQGLALRPVTGNEIAKVLRQATQGLDHHAMTFPAHQSADTDNEGVILAGTILQAQGRIAGLRPEHARVHAIVDHPD